MKKTLHSLLALTAFCTFLSGCGGSSSGSGSSSSVPFPEASEDSYETLVDLDGQYTYALGNGYAVKLRTNINDYIGEDGFFDYYRCAEDLGFFRYDSEIIASQPGYDGLLETMADSPALYETGVFWLIIDEHESAYRARDLYIQALDWDTFGDPEERMNLCAIRMQKLAYYTDSLGNRWGGGGGSLAEFRTADDSLEYPFHYTRAWTSKYNDDIEQTIHLTAQQVILAVYGLEYIRSQYYDYSEGWPQYRSEYLGDADQWESVGIY